MSKLDQPYLKHARAALEPDRTLCGLASEGTPATDALDEDLSPPRYVEIGEYVDCPNCKRVIDFAQASFTGTLKRRL